MKIQLYVTVDERDYSGTIVLDSIETLKCPEVLCNSINKLFLEAALKIEEDLKLLE